MPTLRVVLAVAVLALPAAAVAETSDEAILRIEKRIEALEAKIDAALGRIEKKLDQMGQAGAGDPREKQAAAQLSEINQLASQGKMGEAKERMATFTREFGSTQTAQRALSLQSELSVIGKEAPALEVEKWYQGEADLGNGKATLLVFWEQWCPHCQREVPRLQTLHATFKDQGLQVVGLTKITKSATEEKVQEFIKAQGLTYPMAKEKAGSMSAFFNVSGIPAAAVVKDGKVVWRGHPARLSDDLIKTWL